MAKTSVECRINSINDAKSIVRNQKDILQKVKENNKDSIEFLVSKEIESEVNAIIRGVFRIPTYTSYISPRPGNVLYKIPHYSEKPVEIPIRQMNLTPPKPSVPGIVEPDCKEIEDCRGVVAEMTYKMQEALKQPKKKGGRPFGSKNKSKPKPVEATQ